MARSPGGSRAWLDVPFDDKDAAKRLGARWDPSQRRWYAGPAAQPELLQRWGALPEVPDLLAGEDRSFGSGLFVDLIPTTAWFTNVRSAIPRRDWERLRRMLIRRAGARCELCGNGEDRTARRWLEAHERFAYDATTGIQTLRRLLLLCTPCHEVTHFGLAEVRGRGPAALGHLRAVTGMSEPAAERHVAAAYNTWRGRNARLWSLDLSPLTGAGIGVVPPPGALARAREAEATVAVHRAAEQPPGGGPGARHGGPAAGHAPGCGCDDEPEPGVTVRAVSFDEMATSDNPMARLLRGDPPPPPSTPPAPPAPPAAPSPTASAGDDRPRRWWRRR